MIEKKKKKDFELKHKFFFPIWKTNRITSVSKDSFFSCQLFAFATKFFETVRDLKQIEFALMKEE